MQKDSAAGQGSLSWPARWISGTELWRVFADIAPCKSLISLCEPVAQVVEHETFNLGVVGSSPTGLTTISNRVPVAVADGTGRMVVE